VQYNRLYASLNLIIVFEDNPTRLTLIFFSKFQRQQTLGNKVEMELTNLIEQNPTILRVGLHLEYNDARNRVATHLQRNLDRKRLELRVKLKKEQDGSVSIIERS